MKTEIGKVYINNDGEFFTPAMNGDFYIVDMWPCDNNGVAIDIIGDPNPIPINTCDLKLHGVSDIIYVYPEWSGLKF